MFDSFFGMLPHHLSNRCTYASNTVWIMVYHLNGSRFADASLHLLLGAPLTDLQMLGAILNCNNIVSRLRLETKV
jgi:hypothetical protein